MAMGAVLRRPPSPAMKSIVAAALLLTCSNAWACELSLVAPATSALKNPVQARISLTDDALIASFSVTSPTMNARKVLGPGEHPYQFDVVELFVTFSDSGFPYFEFEVSPYNQTLEVKIVSAKEHHEGVDLGLTSTAQMTKTGWTAEMKIPLKSSGWDGDPGKVHGNLYSILGAGKGRSYWSAFLPKAAKANFHQPQYFKALSRCS
jgi:cellulose/xylan binding protein with CBM9 domain